MQHATAVGVLQSRCKRRGTAAGTCASSSDRRPRSCFRDSSAWKRCDGLLEAVALDEPHGVVGAAVRRRSQSVDGDNPRVLQPAGDLGLDQKPLTADRVVGVVVEDLLERHLAVQLAIQGHEHRAQPAARVRPQDAETLTVACGRADGVTGGAVGVVCRARSSPEPTGRAKRRGRRRRSGRGTRGWSGRRRLPPSSARGRCHDAGDARSRVPRPRSGRATAGHAARPGSRPWVGPWPGSRRETRPLAAPG